MIRRFVSQRLAIFASIFLSCVFVIAAPAQTARSVFKSGVDTSGSLAT
jgi:hypothetical protein